MPAPVSIAIVYLPISGPVVLHVAISSSKIKALQFPENTAYATKAQPVRIQV
jgi:hypothetical protein